MSKKYKYKGEDISEEFVTEGFEQSSFTTLNEYISSTDDLEFIEEDEEENKENFQNGVTGEDAPVVPVSLSRASIIAGVQPEATESASEVISLEQFEVMEPAEKRKLSYGDAQRLIRERDRKEKGGLDSFDVSSSDYSKVTDEEKIKLQDEASKELLKEYEEEGVIDFEITAEQIDEKAIKLLKEKTQPSLLENYGARTARAFTDFVSGGFEVSNAFKFGLTELALNAFDDDYEGTVEEREALFRATKAMSGTANYNLAAKNFVNKLEPYVREYENESMIDDIAEGNYLQAGERAVGAALESLPSVIAAYTGIGGIIALGMSTAGNKFEEEFKRDSSQGTGNLIANGLISGTIEAGFEMATRGVLKRSGLLVKEGMEQAAKDLILGGNKEILKNFGINLASESSSEMATGVTSLIADAAPRWLGGLDREIDISKEWKGIVEAGIVGSVFATTASGTGAIKNRNVDAVAAAESILMPQDGKQAIIKSANKISELHKDRIVADTEGVIILDKAIRAEIINIEEIKRINSKALGNMKPEEIKAYASNNTRIDKLKSIVNKPNQVESVKEIAEQDLRNLTETNNVLFQESSSRRLRENIETANEVTTELGFNEKPQVLNTTKEYLAAIKDAGFDDSQASGSEGVFVGKGKIFIDAERAADVGAVSVATHEILHPILNAVVGDAKAQGSLVGEFKKSMSDSQLKYVQEQLDKNVDKENHDTEFLNYFSDGIVKGDIKYDENIFQKIKNVLKKLFKGQGFKNIDFTKGEDVYEFLKQYNKGAKKGKISSKTIDQIKTGEAKSGVKIADVDIFSQQESKQLTPEQDKSIATEVTDLQVIRKENKDLAAKYGKEPIKGGKETRLENKILESIDPIIGRVVTDRTKALYDPIADDAKKTVSRQNFQESMRSDIQAMVFDEFNGKQDLEKFIVNRAFLRANNLAKRLGIQSVEEGITKGLEAAEKIAIDETVATVDKDVKLTKATKILSNDQLNRAKESIAKMNIDPSQISYKKLGNVTADITAELVGIPADKITSKTKNLSKPETTTAAMFIEKNVDYIRRTLPEGAVLEAATEKLIGTSTGVPKAMLNAFYAKGKRLSKGAGLIPWNKNKGITNNDILEAIGRPKGEKPSPIDPRSPKGQMIKGIISIVDKNITNELVRTEKDLTIEQEVDAGAGRSALMFSKNIPDSKLKTDLQEAINNNRPIADLINIVDNSKEVNKKVFYKVIDDINDLVSQKDLLEQVDATTFEKIAKEQGLEVKSLEQDVKEANANWKKAIPDIGKKFGFDLKYYSEPVLGNAENSTRTLAMLTDVIDMFPNVEILSKDAKQMLAALKATVGSGKSIKIAGERISAAMFMKMANGKGKNKIPSWMKTVYQPAWGYGNGFKGKVERKLKELKDSKIGWEKDYALYAANELTHPSLRSLNTAGSFEGYNKTKQSNLKAIGFVYKGLANNFKKSKNKTIALENIINFLKLQTNHANGIIKGFVPMTMITTEPSGPGDKKTHNEHMKELFNYNNEFIDILAKYQKNPTSDKANFEIDLLVNSLQQGLTSENNKLLKDSKEQGGASGQISENIYANTFLLKGEAASMIMLDKLPGATLNEYLYSKYAPTIFRSMVKNRIKASDSNNNSLPSSIQYSKNISVEASLAALAKTDKALDNARRLDAPVKKIRVFDFDDTLARTKSNVLYTMPDGTKGKIDAATFAKEAGNMEAEGAVWDFSEFSKVMQGTKGPLLEVAKIIADKRGTDDVFVLTARPANAAGPIKEFLASVGLDIPLKNITGLGDGAPQAKAGWIMGKAAEGYNDFYFADDHTGNVKAVKDVLSVLDVKSKVQLAKIQFSKNIDKEFNSIIENKTGIAADKNYASVKAALVGKKKGRFDFFIPPSAEDFLGLLYKTLGKGKTGDAQLEWYKKHLLNPYARAMESISRDRNALSRNFRALKKELKVIPKDLKKKVKDSEFTREQAVRVYIWDQVGKDVPGLSKSDLKELVDMVKSDANLELFAQEVMKLNKGRAYTSPKEGWVSGTITTDLLESLNTTGRKQYLELWQQNVDTIFSEKNLNKMEAAYGKSYRLAMENILGRMKTGRNRSYGTDNLTGRLTDWLTGSIGAIMFFNTRSAVLQTLSAVNFINFGDNNIFAAGKAFANQKQYWNDFSKLWSSDFLIERRDGLKINVNEADIADIAKENGIRGVINKLLKLGFTPTQVADSFAIASGGATFYRNRVKSLTKEGMDITAAEGQAMRDFRETAEESQQSSRPDKISQQQAGPLGRVVLAFANTPAQYARLIKKSASDLKNGRGDAKTNLSKILYYGIAQNLLFNAAQQALFAIAFDEEEEVDKKQVSILNGMVDSVARGTGMGGAIFTVVKNASMRLLRENEKKNPKYEEAALELLKISPPISSKIQKIRSAGRTASWNMDDIKNKGFSLDNPAYLAGGNVVSAATNIPLDRVVKKLNNVVASGQDDIALYKRIALLAGWSDWELGIDSKKNKEVKKETVRTGLTAKGSLTK